MRRSLLLVALAAPAVAAGCEKSASRYASGSGYGVGIPRTHFMVGAREVGRRWTRGVDVPRREYAGPVVARPEQEREAMPEEPPRQHGD